MIRYAMVIDTKRCIGCGDCVIACRMENRVPDGFSRDWVVEVTRGRYPQLHTEFRSERCNHCLHAPCVEACPTGASHRWQGSNIVLVDPNRCTGCKACIAACPYEARFIRPEGYVEKCTFCVHRLRRGLDPACVSTCPTRCMHFGILEEGNSAVSRLLATREAYSLRPETGNAPQVYYLR